MTDPDQPFPPPGGTPNPSAPGDPYSPVDYPEYGSGYPPPPSYPPPPGYPPPYPGYPAPYPGPAAGPAGYPHGYHPYQNPYQDPYYPVPAQGTNGLAIAALVTSIVGFLLTFVGIGWLICVVGVVLGFIALSQIKQTGQSGRGMAVAGIAVGAAVFVLGLLFMAFVGAGLALSGG